MIPATLISPAIQRNRDPMRLYPFTLREAVLILLIFFASGIFSHVQQYFIAPSLRPFTYVLVLFLLMLSFYPAARPADPAALARSLALLLGAIFAILILVLEVLIRHNYAWSSAVVLAGVVICPLAAGWIYRVLLWRPSSR